MAEHHLFKSERGLLAIVGDMERREVMEVDQDAAKRLADLINERRKLGIEISRLLRETGRGAGTDMLGDDDATVVCSTLNSKGFYG